MPASRLRRVAAGAAAALAALTAAPLAATPAAATPGCQAQSIVDSVEREAENAFGYKLNQTRADNGKSALKMNNAVGLDSVAWSEVMSAEDRLYHATATNGVPSHLQYPVLIAQDIPDWQRAAENVGVTGMYSWCDTAQLRSSTTKAVDALHDAFVKSSGHFANMVGDYNQVGIGVHLEHENEMWVTVRFAKGSLPADAWTPTAPATTTSPTSATTKYVNATYTLFLGRAATADEVAFWAPYVQSGNRRALTSALAVSDEWAGVRVNDLYRKILGRDADPGGRAHWVNAIRDGNTLEAVAAIMYASPEYFSKKGSTNSGYVTGLYNDILGRAPDAGGHAHWTGLIDSGRMNRHHVAGGFYASVESRRSRVRTLYNEVLNRDPDPGGWDHWTSHLLSTGDVTLSALLASSEEFYRNSTK